MTVDGDTVKRAPTAEWLEADGLGGFASGTVSGARTRRYHALLLTATTPPTGRLVLVNGIEAWVETAAGRFALSSQRYTTDVTYPDGANQIESFEPEPWPRWRYRLEDGTVVEQELFVPHGRSACVLRWRIVERPNDGAIRLFVRPLMSGRDYHSMHHENGAFRFDGSVDGERVTWRAYDGVPSVVVLSNASYEQRPEWYRSFQYDEERVRGLDFSEDLASPGTFAWQMSDGDAVLVFAADLGEPLFGGVTAAECAQGLAAAERERRAQFASRLHRSADAYIVRRGDGKTIVAGYPWFTDWGRDTFIGVRGLCIAGGRLDDAREILLQWAHAVSQGMLPNRFPDAGAEPDYNAVDASLWYVVAVHDYLSAARGDRRATRAEDERVLALAVEAILDGYERGTRYRIHCDTDGLIAAGEAGVQVTWMDAKIGDWVVTPRTGKPVEVQALWINALRIGAKICGRSQHWYELAERASQSFAARFWNEERGCLFDVVDVNHAAGTSDGALRPNQILAAGGLPFALIDGERALRIVEVVERTLLTPLGLRSLAPGEPGYAPHYGGSPRERDSIYHQGAVWPWLMGAFVDAWVRTRGGGDAVKRDARARFVAPLMARLDEAALGHLCEIADAEAPYTPRGCPFQAWSLGELLRLECQILRTDTVARTRRPNLKPHAVADVTS